MTAAVDVIVFVEDPGSVNMVLSLPNFFEDNGISWKYIAHGVAKKIIQSHLWPKRNALHDYDVECIIEFYQPKLIIVGTSENVNSLGLRLIRESKLAGIETLGLVDMAVNADVRFPSLDRNGVENKPDTIAVVDEFTRAEFIKMGCSAESVINIGHPLYDNVWEKRSQMPIGLDDRSQNKPWLFLAEPADSLKPSESFRSKEYSLFGTGNSRWRTAIVLEELLLLRDYLCPDKAIVVRLHPKMQQSELSHVHGAFEYDTLSNPYQSLCRSDIVFGMTTMLLIEAAILGCKVLSIVPRECEKKWLVPLLLNQLPVVTDRICLRELVANPQHPNWNAPPLESWAIRGASKRLQSLITKCLA